MVFNTISFLVFFAAVILLYYQVPSRFRWIVLLLSSVFFYMFTQPALMLVPVFITLVTYFGGLKIASAADVRQAKLPYLLSIIANVAVLIFFKYANFFTNSFVELANFFNQKISHSGNTLSNGLLVHVIAPLGISYLTFQAIGYLIEIKRGNHPAEKNIGQLFTFLIFFPKIISGPVERAHAILPQLKQPITFKYDNISAGLKLVLWGMFKKLVIADRLAIYVAAVFENTSHHSGLTLVLASVFYVFQMYADFSGYTDMAIGFAKMLGIDIMQNFNRPFFAKSVTEFWRKWHISLSTWFADYFFNPIAIAKRDWGDWAIIYASFITFITLGFWHGANWTFIVFGFLQAVILTLEFFTKKARKNIRKKIPVLLNNALGIGFTFFYFTLSLLFFRADSVTEAFITLKRIATQRGGLFVENSSLVLFSVAGIAFLMLVEYKKEYYNQLFSLSANKNWMVRNLYYCLLVLIILLAGVFDGGQFIYKQF